MTTFEKLRLLVVAGGAEDAEYRRIRDELHNSNRRIVRTFSMLMMIALACLFVFSLMYAPLSGNKALYGVGFVVGLAIYLVATFPGKDNKAVLLLDIYAFSIALMAVGIVLGTVLGKSEIAATYIALLLVVPQLFTDRPYRMYLLILLSDVVFITMVLNLKDAATHTSDVTNAIMFGALSIVLATFSIKTRIERSCLQERIRIMAENDQLTGLRNRNCYEESLARASLLQTEAVYCVYVDVNGLHELNNTKGHEAGDRMLQYIASAMQNLFGAEDTYRIGGDEFVALGLNKKLDVLNALVKSLKQAVESAGYHVAVGIGFMEKKGIEVNAVVKEAERLMYDDKALYYSQNGIDRRRRR